MDGICGGGICGCSETRSISSISVEAKHPAHHAIAIAKKRFYLGLSPKQRTPPTHPYGLGLPKLKSRKFHEIS